MTGTPPASPTTSPLPSPHTFILSSLPRQPHPPFPSSLSHHQSVLSLPHLPHTLPANAGAFSNRNTLVLSPPFFPSISLTLLSLPTPRSTSTCNAVIQPSSAFLMPSMLSKASNRNSLVLSPPFHPSISFPQSSPSTHPSTSTRNTFIQSSSAIPMPSVLSKGRNRNTLVLSPLFFPLPFLYSIIAINSSFHFYL